VLRCCLLRQKAVRNQHIMSCHICMHLQILHQVVIVLHFALQSQLQYHTSEFLTSVRSCRLQASAGTLPYRTA
jgi:hypothetical protein